MVKAAERDRREGQASARGRGDALLLLPHNPRSDSEYSYFFSSDFRNPYPALTREAEDNRPLAKM